MLKVENNYEERQITFEEIEEGDVFIYDLDTLMLKLPRVCLADDVNNGVPMIPTYNAYAFDTGEFNRINNSTVVDRPNKAILKID